MIQDISGSPATTLLLILLAITKEKESLLGIYLFVYLLQWEKTHFKICDSNWSQHIHGTHIHLFVSLLAPLKWSQRGEMATEME